MARVEKYTADEVLLPNPQPLTPSHYFDWQSIVDQRADDRVENTRTRLVWMLGLFSLAALIVFVRAVQLEVSDGANFRRLAAQPIERRVALPARRGRILARDGALLAGDRQARALAVQYRYLENPPDAAWLRRTARARLSPAERRKPDSVAQQEAALRDELAELHRRLAQLCKLSDEQWQARTGRIQKRVGALAARVNARRLEGFQTQAEVAAEDAGTSVTLASALEGLFVPPEPLPPPTVTIVEQAAFHHIVEDVTAEVATEIQDHPQRYPGVKIVEHVRRDYPHGSLAAHLIGHVTKTLQFASEAATRAETPQSHGLMGVELRFDDRLAGRAGWEIQQVDRRGNVLLSRRIQEPLAGDDVVLSIDDRLQRSAEAWLDRRLRGHGSHAAPQRSTAQGGAVVVMDIRSGELLTAASSPRFDPNWFAAGDERVEAILHDARRPMFDRVTKMAIPPGSVFKPLSAIALLENKAIDPQVTFRCQGYLDEPDRLRCQIFRQHGIGHGELTLADALAQSCNVYFFHHAADLGAVPLVDWAARFGFGRPTGIDLADESPGRLPDAAQLHATSQTQLLAIGQGPLTVTPLQIVRMYAAIANGGRLVTPRLVKQAGRRWEAGGNGTASETSSLQPPASGLSVPGLTPASLAAVREGLRRVVEDPNGTAYSSARVPWPAVAGKTGTAETGGELADHAWFAGYAPATDPLYAFVVVLEHGGSGADAAGSIARDLVLKMRELGYFGSRPIAERPIPPGKG